LNTIVVDREKCVGCKLCYRACWRDVIRWDEKENVPRGVYMEDCAECNWCEIICPHEAITVKIDYSRPFPSPYIPGKN
jgi:NAD-dependent dihydropyrimidine dehydrogenase PreA subunit